MKGKRRHILPVCLMILFCLIGWAGAGRIHAQAAGEEEPEEYDFEETFGDIYVYFEGRPKTLEEEDSYWRMRRNHGPCRVEGNYMYEVVSSEEKTAVILHARGLEGDVEFPQEIDGYQVIGLGDNMEEMLKDYDSFFTGNYRSVFLPSEAGKITGLTIPEGVEYISLYAFWGCQNLTWVELPDSLEAIWWGAFTGSKIREMELPEGMEHLDENSFSGMDELREVTFREPDEILYTVQKGDTLWKLYREYGCPVEEIAERNGIRDINLILIGQELWIPVAE